MNCFFIFLIYSSDSEIDLHAPFTKHVFFSRFVFASCIYIYTKSIHIKHRVKKEKKEIKSCVWTQQ